MNTKKTQLTEYFPVKGDKKTTPKKATEEKKEEPVDDFLNRQLEPYE